MTATTAQPRDSKFSKRLLVISAILMGAILAAVYGYVFLNLDKLEDRSLSTTAQCPGCDGVITMWDQTASPDPDSVQCSECDELIQESLEHFVVLEAAAVTAFVVIIATIILSAITRAWRRMWCALIVFLIYWALLELGVNLLLFNYAELSVI